MSKEIKRGELWVGPHLLGIEPESRQHWQLLDKLAQLAVGMGLDDEQMETFEVKKGLESQARPVGALLPVVKDVGEKRLADSSNMKGIKEKGEIFNLISLAGVWPLGMEEWIERQLRGG